MIRYTVIDDKSYFSIQDIDKYIAENLCTTPPKIGLGFHFRQILGRRMKNGTHNDWECYLQIKPFDEFLDWLVITRSHFPKQYLKHLNPEGQVKFTRLMLAFDLSKISWIKDAYPDVFSLLKEVVFTET